MTVRELIVQLKSLGPECQGYHVLSLEEDNQVSFSQLVIVPAEHGAPGELVVVLTGYDPGVSWSPTRSTSS